MDNAINVVSCGCCSLGCVCWNHQDVPMGRPVTTCDRHQDAAVKAADKDAADARFIARFGRQVSAR